MKQILYLSSLLIFFMTLFGCAKETEGRQNPYMCICASERTEKTEDDRMIKDIFVYLVRGSDLDVCCTGSAADSQPAFHEIWYNGGMDKPMLWEKQDDLSGTMKASKAQSELCSRLIKTVQSVDLKELPMASKMYYSNLKLRDIK